MNFKTVLLLFAFLLAVSLVSYAQKNDIKTGAYRNSVDFNRNKPLYKTEFNLKAKHNKHIPNLYEIKPEDVKISNKILNKAIWGIYQDSCFYLNAERIGMEKGYIKIGKIRRYCYFVGLPVKSLNQQARLETSAFTFGLTGALVSNSVIDKETKNDTNYVINMKSGMPNLLTKDYMLRILKPYPGLLIKYQHEENNESLGIRLKYIDMLNQKIEKTAL